MTETVEVPAQTVETNADRKAKKLRDKIDRQHKWRVEVWAGAQIRIDAMQQELVDMEKDTVDLFKPDFDDKSLLPHYANVEGA